MRVGERVCSQEGPRSLQGRLAAFPRSPRPVTETSPTEQSITIVRDLQDMTVMEPAPAWFECEISIPSVRPPKWLLGKTVLQAGADVGVEQEGTVHRLTLRRTCSTMTGPVHFTIGKSRSTARLVVSGERAQRGRGCRWAGAGRGQWFWGSGPAVRSARRSSALPPPPRHPCGAHAAAGAQSGTRAAVSGPLLRLQAAPQGRAVVQRGHAPGAVPQVQDEAGGAHGGAACPAAHARRRRRVPVPGRQRPEQRRGHRGGYGARARGHGRVSGQAPVA